MRQSTRCKLKVKLHLVFGVELQIHHAPGELIEDLEEVVTWPKGKDGVQRRDIAASSGEVEKVRVSIGREPVLRLRFRELLLVNGEVRGEPRDNISIELVYQYGACFTCQVGHDAAYTTYHFLALLLFREIPYNVNRP